MTAERMAAIAAVLARHRPDWPPLGAAAQEAIRASVDSAPPMTDKQRRIIGRLLRGSKNWNIERGDAA